MSLSNAKLDQLVRYGSIYKYRLEELGEDGNPGKSQFRNNQRLTIEFDNGETLIISTFCSGTTEDTVFVFNKPTSYE